MANIDNSEVRELINGCINQDRDAKRRLYELYHRPLYSTALRITNDARHAEDLMHDSMIEAIDKMHAYRTEAPLGTWLKRIVVNKSLNFIRKQGRELLTDQHDQLDGQTEALTETDISERIDLIKECITKLPDGYRVVLSLYLLEGYDHEEIGSILGIESSTSRSQYTKARRRLQQIISEHD